jgi:hypothetical protein
MFKVSVYFYSRATVLHNSGGGSGGGGELLQLLAVVGTGLCLEVNRTPLTELTVPGSGVGTEKYVLLHLNKRYKFFILYKQTHKVSLSLLSTGRKPWLI